MFKNDNVFKSPKKFELVVSWLIISTSQPVTHAGQVVYVLHRISIISFYILLPKHTCELGQTGLTVPSLDVKICREMKSPAFGVRGP